MVDFGYPGKRQVIAAAVFLALDEDGRERGGAIRLVIATSPGFSADDEAFHLPLSTATFPEGVPPKESSVHPPQHEASELAVPPIVQINKVQESRRKVPSTSRHHSPGKAWTSGPIRYPSFYWPLSPSPSHT